MNRRVLAIMAAALAGCSGSLGDSSDNTNGALTAPSDLTAAALPGGRTVALKWSDNSNMETGFRIDVRGGFEAPADLGCRIAPSNSTTYDFAAIPGVTLYFHVVAVTDTTESIPSNEAVVRIPAVPLAPQGLKAGTSSSSEIHLQWWASDNTLTYRIERSLDTTSWVIATTVPDGTLTYSDTGLLPDTEYTYRVIATNDDGDSVPSHFAYALTATTAMAISTAYSATDAGKHSSLAVDSGGNEHISHLDSAVSDCLYTAVIGDSTLTTTADSGPSPNSSVATNGTSSALDREGHIHIAARDATHSALRYSTNAGGSLAAVTVDSTGSRSGPKLQMSPVDDSVQIVYDGGGYLKRAVLAAGAWTFESIPSAEYVGAHSFALDEFGVPHAAFIRSADGLTYELIYATRASGEWVLTPLTSEGRPTDNSLAIGPGGAIHIAYYESESLSSSRLMHAWKDGAGWSFEVIDQKSVGGVGRYNAIAIDHATHIGRIHVAYHDGSAQDLLYARKDPGTGWVRRVLDVSGAVGSYPSVAIDTAGMLHVSYRDETNKSLKRGTGAP